MAKHAGRRNSMAGKDILTELDQRCHLGLWKGPVAEVMAGVDQLDADGDAVDVALPGPIADAGMPGAARFIDQAMNQSVFLDQVVAADLGRGIPEALERGLGIAHAGGRDWAMDSR